MPAYLIIPYVLSTPPVFIWDFLTSVHAIMHAASTKELVCALWHCAVLINKVVKCYCQCHLQYVDTIIQSICFMMCIYSFDFTENHLQTFPVAKYMFFLRLKQTLYGSDFGCSQ